MHQGLALGWGAAGDVGATACEFGAQGVACLGQAAGGQGWEFGSQVVEDAIDEVGVGGLGGWLGVGHGGHHLRDFGF